MLRVIAIAAMFALAVPTLAVAQGEHHEHRPPGARPVPRPGPRPAIVPHGQPRPQLGGPHAGPGGPVGRQFSYRGHMINRLHLAPFAYPHGWGYRRWAVGAALPALFLVPAYYYADWGALGLAPPPQGYQWVRYGPDLLLVDVSTGQIADVAYGVFY